MFFNEINFNNILKIHIYHLKNVVKATLAMYISRSKFERFLWQRN